MNMMIAALLASVSPGDQVCWHAPMPSLSKPRIVEARVVEVKRLPTGDPGAWITADAFPGQQWHVALDALHACQKPEASAADKG